MLMKKDIHGDTDFKGYKGKCTYLFEENSYEGEFLLGEDFKASI